MITPAQAAIVAKVDDQMRVAHASLYVGCQWRDRADAVRDAQGWVWFGCSDHAPCTSSGIGSTKTMQRGRETLRVATITKKD